MQRRDFLKLALFGVANLLLSQAPEVWTPDSQEPPADNLLPKQRQFVESNAGLVGFVGGRAAGKTLLLMHAITPSLGISHTTITRIFHLEIPVARV